MLLQSVKGAFLQNRLTKLSALLMRRSIEEMKRTYDASEHGGAPLLGISRPVIKAHGSSDAKAFKNAIFQAIRYAESDVIYSIAEAAERFVASANGEKTEKDPERVEKNEVAAANAAEKGGSC